jgi:hypothetical protein
MDAHMTLGWPISDALHTVAKRADVRRCLEVGTGGGEGSTLCIAKALAESGGSLTSIELKPEHHAQVSAFYAGSGLPVRLEQGLTLSAEDYAPFEVYWPRVRETAVEAKMPGAYREWYDEEVAYARTVRRRRVLQDVISAEAPFDLVLLDGGEFLSNAEFYLVEPFVNGWLVLDDTNGAQCIKNAEARERLLMSPEWEIIVDEPDDRNGWMMARRR